MISSLIAGLWKSLIVDCDAMVDGRCGLNGLRRKMDASEVLGPHLSLSVSINLAGPSLVQVTVTTVLILFSST